MVVCIYLLFLATNISTTEESRAIQLFENISTSSAVCTINKLIYRCEEMLDTSSYKSVPNPIFHDLAREAMVKMKLPRERHVPVYAMCIENGGNSVYAQAPGRFIFVNEKLMNNKSHGVCRFILFHEVAHIKYHSGLTDPLLGAAICVGVVSTLANSMINDDSGLGQTWFYQIGIAIPLLFALIKIFSFAAEGHADRKAIQYIQCTNCVNEYIKYAPTTFNWKGDLTKNECIKWNKKYNPNGKMCEYHKIRSHIPW